MIPVGLFTLAASIGMVFALLHELRDAHDLSGGAIGWIAGVSFFAAVASQLLIAPFADRGHARRVMALSILGGAVASFTFALAAEPWQFIFARIAAGLAFGAYLPAAQAVFTAADPDRAGQNLGRLAGIQTAGFIIGPGIGAGLVAAWGLDAPFYCLAGALTLLIAPVATIHVDEVVSDGPPLGAWRTAGDMLVTMARISRRREALAAAILSAALIMPAGMYEAIWAIFLQDLGASTTFIGISLVLYGFPFMIAAPIGGRLADRHEPMRIAMGALAAIIPLTVIYGHLTVPLLLMSLAMIEGTANGFGMPSAQTLMATSTKDGERATGQGLAAATGQLAAGGERVSGPQTLRKLRPRVDLLLGRSRDPGAGHTRIRDRPQRPHQETNRSYSHLWPVTNPWRRSLSGPSPPSRQPQTARWVNSRPLSRMILRISEESNPSRS